MQPIIHWFEEPDFVAKSERHVALVSRDEFWDFSHFLGKTIFQVVTKQLGDMFGPVHSGGKPLCSRLAS